ncbi:DUF1942 domain-containing protein [Rhodococcoides corynebacterioides]|uniref:DUF1942 domain-containing protein n=1 Tax=Rhodococcoides corynebacterioides TaxID=53972 RepID=UPI003F8134C0
MKRTLIATVLVALALTAACTSTSTPETATVGGGASPATSVPAEGGSSGGSDAPAAAGSALTIDSNGATREVTIEGYGPATPAQYGLPATGELVQVTVTIRGIEGTTQLNPLYFTARAEDGTSYQAALGAIDGQLDVGTVPAGDVIRGAVAFDVTGAPVQSIRYTDELGGQLGTWNVQ